MASLSLILSKASTFQRWLKSTKRCRRAFRSTEWITACFQQGANAKILYWLSRDKRVFICLLGLLRVMNNMPFPQFM